MEIFELSIRSHVDHDAVFSFLSEALNIAPCLIGNDAAYWERSGSPAQLAVGVKIRWSDNGYRTFVVWYQEAELSGSELLTIAMRAAEFFCTWVAIGDVMVSSNVQCDRFLIATPEGTIWRAHEKSNGELFELDVTSPVGSNEICEFLHRR